MKKIALGLPLLMMAPLLLLFLGMGNANIAAVQAACGTAATSTGTGTGGVFGIGTLNWRGASHYKKNPHPGERPYSVRVPNMVAKVGASGASIIGFQEFEPPQARAFLKATHGAWEIVKGRAHGNPATADSIAYQPGVWTVAEVRYVAIKYGGPTVQIPLVRFTSTKGLGSIWVLNTHNPANVVHGSDSMRDDAVRAEATTLRRLQTAEPNTPLFLTGDMNDKARFKNLFLTTAGTGWSSANPGDHQIDWIMGSSAVTFSGTVADKSTNDNAHAYTDHPFLYTSAQLTIAPGAAATSTGTGQARTVVEQSAAPADSSGAQVAAKAAYQAGFRGGDLVTAVAIAHVESSWNPNASNGTHFGLWQIAASHKGLVPGWSKPRDIFDPLLNARYAFALYSDRPGSGGAKFADWLPFEHDDYHQYLAQARQAVAATVGTGALTPVANPEGSTGAGCAGSPITVAGDLSTALSARINAMQHTPGGLCRLTWTHGAPCTYSGQCPKVVDALYGGPGVGRGYGNGQDVAQGIINAGLAQAHGTGLDPLPPVGAVVSYNRGDGVGHVAIYVGNGKIFGNDYGCSADGVYGCVGFADVHTPAGSVTWALPKPRFDLGGAPAAAA